MDYSLNEDQAALVAAVQSIVDEHMELPQSERLNFYYYDEQLQSILDQGGFLDAAKELSLVEAALIVIETGRTPACIEAASTALVAVPLVPGDRPQGPIALIDWTQIKSAHRNLSIAKTALIRDGADVYVLPIKDGDVEAVKSIYAYPYGRFKTVPDLRNAQKLTGLGDKFIHYSRLALASEFAGAVQAAVAFSVDYVKERQVFGRPVGTFQSVQHRLVECYQIAQSIYYLTLRAAWSGLPSDASMAACYAQQSVKKILFDLHQFNGGMGVTNEHALHFWTYRLRALQSEAGGVIGSALDISRALWGHGNQTLVKGVSND